MIVFFLLPLAQERLPKQLSSEDKEAPQTTESTGAIVSNWIPSDQKDSSKIESIEQSLLNEYLCDYFVYRKPNVYSLESIELMYENLKSFLNRRIMFDGGIRFEDMRDVIETRKKIWGEFMRNLEDRHFFVNDELQEKLYRAGELSSDTPGTLQFALILAFRKAFGLEKKAWKFGDFTLKRGSDGQEYIFNKEKGTILKNDGFITDPIKLYKKFILLRPKEMMRPESPLFLVPIKKNRYKYHSGERSYHPCPMDNCFIKKATLKAFEKIEFRDTPWSYDIPINQDDTSPAAAKSVSIKFESEYEQWLYKTGKLSPDTPRGLQLALFLAFRNAFNLPEKVNKLKLDDFSIIIGDNGQEYIEMQMSTQYKKQNYPDQEKRVLGKDGFVIDPIKLYRKFRSVRPSEEMHPNSPFFLLPNAKFVTESHCEWYHSQPVGEHYFVKLLYKLQLSIKSIIPSAPKEDTQVCFDKGSISQNQRIPVITQGKGKLTLTENQRSLFHLRESTLAGSLEGSTVAQNNIIPFITQVKERFENIK